MNYFFRLVFPGFGENKQTSYVKKYQRALRLHGEISKAVNSYHLPISNSKGLVGKIFLIDSCELLLTTATCSSCLRWQILPCPTRERVPVTGDMHTPQPLCLPAGHISTNPASPEVLAVSWSSWRAGRIYCWPSLGAAKPQP